MDTGVRDLEVVFFKANSSRFNDLNTHSLEMILQLKYMAIVMNPARIVSSD